jgi:hypothetical protein
MLQIQKARTPRALSMIILSTINLFISTLYIAPDTGYTLTGHFEDDLEQWKSIALYILYLVVPLLCAVGYLIAQIFIVVKVADDKRRLCKFLFLILVPRLCFTISVFFFSFCSC